MMRLSSSGRLVGLAVLIAIVSASAARTAAHDPTQPPHDRGASPEHIHAPVPEDYAKQAPPPHFWTDKAVVARGAAIHAAKCAVCHGTEGAGDGPAVAGLILKPASFRDKAMVAEMSPAYWFWRVSEGGVVEQYMSNGSAMPQY
jgi:hypothetical protein